MADASLEWALADGRNTPRDSLFGAMLTPFGAVLTRSRAARRDATLGEERSVVPTGRDRGRSTLHGRSTRALHGAIAVARGDPTTRKGRRHEGGTDCDTTCRICMHLRMKRISELLELFHTHAMSRPPPLMSLDAGASQPARPARTGGRTDRQRQTGDHPPHSLAAPPTDWLAAPPTAGAGDAAHTHRRDAGTEVDRGA